MYTGPKQLAAHAKQDGNRSERGDFLIMRKARLALSDGQSFAGQTPEWVDGEFGGEVVFNTGMTGYVESLTDPSYANQILVFTYPLIGNYGVQPEDTESDKIQVSGVVVNEAALAASHSGSQATLLEWLKSQDIPILIGADTRALTKYLRSRGTMPGVITTRIRRPAMPNLAPARVTIGQPTTYNKERRKKIVLVDCGTKENIVRSLKQLPVQIIRVPLDYDYTNDDYDGVVLSNGPGDPTDYPETIAITKKALRAGKPMFGICLGTQMMALAAGAKTYKLPYGHRGHNQPCIETGTKRCYITSQNHGYAIDEKSLPKGWEVSFRNLNDQSVEGIRHRTKPFFSVQFHPEAAPGPTDTQWLFETFKELL